MSLTNTETSWGSVSKTLHWLLFVLVFSQLCMGLFIDQLDTDIPAQYELSLAIWPYHEGLGLTVFPVALITMIWRIATKRPKMLEMPLWQKIAGHIVHNAIHIIIMLMPIAGFIQTQAYGFPVNYFGLFTFPKFFEKSVELEKGMHAAHEMQGWILTALIILHIGGALKHHFIDKDETLSRFLPGRG